MPNLDPDKTTLHYSFDAAAFRMVVLESETTILLLVAAQK